MKIRNHLFNIIGLLILTGMVVFLFGFTVYEAWVLHSLGGIFVLVVFLGVCLTVFYEWKAVLQDSPQVVLTQETLKAFIAVFVGGLLSFTLSHDVGLGPVVAASLVGICANLVLPALDVPFYCGAFIGMTSNNLLYHHGEVALASLGAALVYVLTQNVFKGFGGKLGTIALFGTVMTGTGLAREFIILPIPDWSVIMLIVGMALVAAPLTFYLNHNRRHGAAMASAVVGLAGGLILPRVFPTRGSTLAVVMICASFAGMSARFRCQRFFQILLAGLATGIVFAYATPLLGGAGGKLGTIAFGAVLSVFGYCKVLGQIAHPDETLVDQGS